nr:MAG: hypothetical protein AM324_07875 [Candidatus Thorarchaeota archaeon SMTZ1-83]
MEVKEKMKRSVLILPLVIMLVVLSIAPAAEAKPLYGTMDLEFNLGWPEYNTEVPDWVGTITINGEEYGMLFFAFWTGKPFENPQRGNAFFFGEIWAIYDMGDLSFPAIPNGKPSDWAYWLPSDYPDELVLWGYDEGVTIGANTKYHMNGNVEEGFDAFSVYEGRNVHMRGVIEWYEDMPAPHYAPGIFRIN